MQFFRGMDIQDGARGRTYVRGDRNGFYIEIWNEQNTYTINRKYCQAGDDGYAILSMDTATVGLGHKRLSIIELSAAGHQPMHYQHWTIVFNGEIYNYREVMVKLESAGYTFDSNSDTSVILKAFDHWGTKAVEQFIGMFAFFILDKRSNKGYLFRDRVGVKPVYFHSGESIFLFASELKSITRHPRFKKELDQHALALYFQHGYIPAPYSVYKATYKLQPGHFLEINLKTREIKDVQYWDVATYYGKPRLAISESETESEVEKIVLGNDVVKKWLEGKQPKKIIYKEGKMVNVVV